MSKLTQVKLSNLSKGLLGIGLIGGVAVFSASIYLDANEPFAELPQVSTSDVSQKADGLDSTDLSAIKNKASQLREFRESNQQASIDLRSDPNDSQPINVAKPTFSSAEAYAEASMFGALPSHMNDLAMAYFDYDQQGNLIVNAKVKQIIEFFLLAKDVEGYEQAVARIEEFIALSLPESAQSQALELVSSYLNYKQNLAEHHFAVQSDFSDPNTIGNIRNALTERKALRREYMGKSVSEAIFGHEERYDDFSLRRVEINANPELSVEEKDQLMAEAEAKLPEKMAKKMQRQRNERAVNARIEELKAQGGQEEEIYALRKDLYGKGAADRYAYIEEVSPQWRERVNQFTLAQQSILADQSLSREQKNDRISDLRGAHFSEKEQIKLAVQKVKGII